MYNIKSNLIAVLFFVVGYSTTTFAQAESFEMTLQQAQGYAIQNSYMSITADKEVQIADSQVLETIGTGLHKVNASANFKQ